MYQNGSMYTWSSGGTSTYFGTAQSLMHVGATGVIYVLNNGNIFESIDGNASYQIGQGAIADGQGGFWYLDMTNDDGLGDHAVCHFSPSHSPTSSSVFATAMGQIDGSLWILNSQNQVSRLDTSSNFWVQVSSGVDSYGNVWFLDPTTTDGHGNEAVCRWSGTQLLRAPGAYASGIGVAEQAIWISNSYQQVYRWNGLQFIQQSSVVDAYGDVWFLGTTNADHLGNHAIYLFEDGQLVQIPGYANGLGIAEQSVWICNTIDQVYRWNGTNWSLQSSIVASDGSLLFPGFTDPNTIYLFANGQLSVFVSDTSGLALSNPLQQVQKFLSGSNQGPIINTPPVNLPSLGDVLTTVVNALSAGEPAADGGPASDDAGDAVIAAVVAVEASQPSNYSSVSAGFVASEGGNTNAFFFTKEFCDYACPAVLGAEVITNVLGGTTPLGSLERLGSEIATQAVAFANWYARIGEPANYQPSGQQLAWIINNVFRPIVEGSANAIGKLVPVEVDYGTSPFLEPHLCFGIYLDAPGSSSAGGAPGAGTIAIGTPGGTQPVQQPTGSGPVAVVQPPSWIPAPGTIDISTE